MIEAPPKEKRQDNQDPVVCSEENNPDLDPSVGGGDWNSQVDIDTDYLPFISTWRRQSPTVSKQINTKNMEHYSAFETLNISQISYDLATKTLQASFHNVGSYQYYDVPADIWSEFKAAASKGKFLHQHIKDQHHFVKI